MPPEVVSLLTALEATGAATMLRQSTWLYPLVNAAHIAALALLFGGIVPLDLRLIGAWPRVPVAPLARVLVPMAMAGAVLAMVTGVALFSVRAVHYAGMAIFQIKMAVVAAGLVNALLLHRSAAWLDARETLRGPTPARARAGAMASVGLWIGAIVLGRLIGFFD